MSVLLGHCGHCHEDDSLPRYHLAYPLPAPMSSGGGSLIAG